MRAEATQIDIAIIGGGIVGLWICRELLSKHPQYTIALFEKESYLLEHTSGRNSEVLHAGIYYSTNSMKHRFCIEGNSLWREYFKKHQLDFLDCGKYIVSPEDEGTELDAIYEQAKKNDVPDLSWAKQETVKTLSEVVKVKRAFYSPSSAVLNVANASKRIQQEIEAKGGIILIKNEIAVVEKTMNSFQLTMKDDSRVISQYVVNAAGLGAVGLRQQLGLFEYSNFFVKGNYLSLKKSLALKNLIYPVPPKDKLSLGVHLTLDSFGNQKFGPDSELVDEINYQIPPSVIDKMFPSIKNLFHTVTIDQLQLAYSGIRPKVKNTLSQIEPDFIIQSPISNYLELLGIESPGLTASPAIAKFVSDKI